MMDHACAQYLEIHVYVGAHVPLLEDHPLLFQRKTQCLGLYQIIHMSVGPLGLVADVVVAWPIVVGPLGQRVRTSHRWRVRWKPMEGRRLIVVVAALAVVVVGAAVLEPLGLRGVLVSMRAPLVNLQPSTWCRKHIKQNLIIILQSNFVLQSILQGFDYPYTRK